MKCQNKNDTEMSAQSGAEILTRNDAEMSAKGYTEMSAQTDTEMAAKLMLKCQLILIM